MHKTSLARPTGYKCSVLRVSSLIGLAILLPLTERQVKGDPVGSAATVQTVHGWLKANATPFRERLGEVRDVSTFRDNNGNPQYYVVNLQPAGFVVVAGDDLVEPVVAFSSHGAFDPSTNNPLVSLLSRDMPLRLAQARQIKKIAPGSVYEKARKKWQKLRQAPGVFADDSGTVSAVDAGISDIRVLPLVQSCWDQLNVGTNACYNYYTPPPPPPPLAKVRLLPPPPPEPPSNGTRNALP
jgi:hypothetical protein